MLVPAALAVLAGQMLAAAQQEQVVRVAQGQAVGVQADVGAVQLLRVRQSQHVAPLLAEAGEVEAGEVHEGDVGGEDDVVGGDGAMGGGHLVVGDVGDFGVLVDDQRLRHAPEELQRVELCLVGEHHRTLHREGQASLLHKLRPKAQVAGGVPLFF